MSCLRMLPLLVAIHARVSTGVLLRSGVTPVEKVVDLLKKLKAEVEAGGKDEAKTYDKFACFCKKKSTGLSDGITKSQDKIEEASATIGELTAKRVDKKTELKDAVTKKEELEGDLKNTKARFAKEKEEYEAANSDISKGIAALVDAIKTLKTSKSSKAGLLSVKATVQHSLAVADALKIIVDGPKWAAAASFLQARVDPDDPEYKFHSDGIISIMEKLEKEFREKKSEQDAEWEKTRASLMETIKDLGSQISSTTDLISKLETTIDTLTKDIAETRGSLVEEEASLKDSQLYMKDLTALCEKRAQEWDQRTVMRSKEIVTLTKALEILEGKVTTTDSVNERALVQEQHDEPGASPSFFQEGQRVMHHSDGKLRVRARTAQMMSSEVAQGRRLNQALTFLRAEGGRLMSTALSTLAARAAEDPFIKVKTLIQKLIERLLKESTAEATKKGFCDTELGKANQDRKFRWDEVLKLNGELRTLEAKKLALDMEISDLTEAVKDLKKALKEATEARKKDKEQNLKDIATANDGLGAITEAIMILKAFYTSAAKAALVQQHASPVDEDNPGAGFDGAYRGSQKESTGIIGLLEVIKSDYERTVKVTTEDEASSHATFIKFDRTSKADISGKSKKLELDKEDLKTTKSSINMKTKEMQDNMNLVDEALKAIENLKPMCIDTGMSYAERVQKREEEMKALKKALCILDPAGVEEECED
mmetsp:Transcript_25805/g.49438  ORF Transcript_25805/g.49438 Transcript_25805/m.49438 type:complete len:711 (-) Transcript_25805:84-2216(-)